MLGFKAVPGAPEPCCPTHWTMATIGIFDKCQWNHKKTWPNKDSNPDLLLEKLFTPRTTETLYFEIEIIGENTVIKKPYWMNNFSYMLKYVAKNYK